MDTVLLSYLIAKSVFPLVPRDEGDGGALSSIEKISMLEVSQLLCVSCQEMPNLAIFTSMFGHKFCICV